MSVRSRVAQFFAANKSLLIFFALMMMFRSAVADWMLVPSGSMNPTLIEGDRILVDKAAYGWRIPFTTTRLTRGDDPKRGDIVIFPSPQDGTTLVKRVIGVPGDTVQMRDERLLINDVAVEYARLDDDAVDAELPRATDAQTHRYFTENLAGKAHSIMLLPSRAADRSFDPVVVPDDHYLVLGDSRDNSKDSRYIGFVPRDSIVGRAFGVAYSLDADRWYQPRTERFFARLR
jgi:signal peptidase I